jgi:hypothetical protein
MYTDYTVFIFGNPNWTFDDNYIYNCEEMPSGSLEITLAYQGD